MIIVLMGVSGSGKTTVGELLAGGLGVEFVEGDAYHPHKNVEKMRRGIPLDDGDRWPWLEALGAEIDRWLAAGKTVVLACSALKQSYRDLLAEGRPEVRFVYLKGDESLLRARLERRRGHYMPPSLLASQIATLEEPADAITVDVDRSPEAIAAEICRELSRPQAQDVRFTTYHPNEITPGMWDTLLVYIHVPEMNEWVQTDARSRLARAESHRPRTGRATRSIARGAEIVVVPELTGCRFNPPTDRFLWLEDAHRREFRLQADPGVPGFEPGMAVNGRVAFYVASILVAEVNIWTFIADQVAIALRDIPSPGRVTSMGLVGGTEVQTMPSGAPAQPVTATAAPYNAIFVSYAQDDATVVARVGAAYKALRMSFLRDQEVLRSGEKWNPRLLDLIERADIFQLYWSGNARRSRYVRHEWLHALQQDRDNFIRPVYWQKPMPKPPRELKELHFAYLPLDG